jgi:hypothetical protein
MRPLRCCQHVAHYGFLARAAGWAVLLLASCAAARSYGREPVKVLADINVNPRGDLLVVPVTIDGRDYPFALDTGAAGSLFDSALRRFLGAPVQTVLVQGLFDEKRAVRYAMPSVRVARIPFASRAGAVCTDLRDEARSHGQDIYGIIGTDFLRDKIFRVDFDHGKLQFLDRADEGAGERFALEWQNGTPHLLLDVLPGSPKEPFTIDTGHCGFDSGCLRLRLFLELWAAQRLKPIDGADDGDDDSPFLNRYVGTFADFSVGEFTHHGLVFTEATDSVLGLAYLSRYVVTFDLAHSALYVKPGREYAKRDRFRFAGLSIMRADGKTVVHDVKPDKPAAKLGLEGGDAILEVDGILAAKTSVFELARLFATPGKHSVRFTRKRDGTVHEAGLVLVEPKPKAGSRASMTADEVREVLEWHNAHWGAGAKKSETEKRPEKLPDGN